MGLPRGKASVKDGEIDPEGIFLCVCVSIYLVESLLFLEYHPGFASQWNPFPEVAVASVQWAHWDLTYDMLLYYIIRYYIHTHIIMYLYM